MLRSVYTASFLVYLLAGCQGRENPYGTAPQNPAPGQEAARVAQSLAGTYADTVPCSDCRGVATQLLLNADSSFVLRETYLDKKPEPVEQRGTWRVRGKVLSLPPSGSHPGRSYLVDNPRQLVLLDGSGKPINDPKLDYSLERQ